MHAASALIKQHHWAKGFQDRRQWSEQNVIPDRINGHMSIAKVSLQDGVHKLWFHLERKGLSLVYLFIIITIPRYGHKFAAQINSGG